MGSNAGQELAFGFGDAKLVKRSLDFGRNIVPRLALAICGADKIVDVLKVEVVKIPTPLWKCLLKEHIQSFETKLAHPVGFAFHLRDFFDGPAIQALAGLVVVVGFRLMEAVLVIVFDPGNLCVQVS